MDPMDAICGWWRRRLYSMASTRGPRCLDWAICEIVVNSAFRGVMLSGSSVPCLQRGFRVSLVPVAPSGTKRWRGVRVKAQQEPPEAKPESETPPSDTEPSPTEVPPTIGGRLERYRQGSLITEQLARRTVEEGLYSDNWNGDEYIGSNWNILTVILILSVATPFVGLVFAYFTYGTLWGTGMQAL